MSAQMLKTEQKEQKKILIVDDEAETIEYIQKMLERSGYTVFTASNGMEGLTIVESEKLDLILTDMIMPVMDGIDLSNELKRRKETASIPLVFISAGINFSDHLDDAQGADFLPKPFNATQLIQKIEGVFERVENLKKLNLKVLVLSNQGDSLETMAEKIESDGWNAELSALENDRKLISEALMTKPDVIVIDMLSDGFSASQCIKELSSLYGSEKSFIFICEGIAAGHHQNPQHQQTQQSFMQEKAACLDAGATQFIGKLSKESLYVLFHRYCDHFLKG